MKRRNGNWQKGLQSRIAVVVLTLILLFCTFRNMDRSFFFPYYQYAALEDNAGGSLFSEYTLAQALPFYGYLREEEHLLFETESGGLLFPEDREEAGEEPSQQMPYGQEGMDGTKQETDERTENGAADREGNAEGDVEEALTLSQLAALENAAASQTGQTALTASERDTGDFTPAEAAFTYRKDEYEDYESLMKTFYTVDANALAGNDLFSVEQLTEPDFSIDRSVDGPQILIYHTHSREAFCDSAPGVAAESIVGVGDFLAQILTEEYGYRVLHDTTEYDTTREQAYANSLPAIETILKENTSIQVVIDLHRDAAGQNRDMTVEIDGKKMARFMFFNGISRSRSTGDIEYLYNPNLAGNLAFSFQLQQKAGEYYPGLAKRIYIKQYRYNLHLLERSVLIELGDDQNTLEEAMNTCYPLAHILSLVLQ